MANRNTHQEFELTHGNEDAIVFVHGILGSPCQFQTLADELSGQGFDCKVLLLPGHGGSGKAFYQTPYGKWFEYVKHSIDKSTALYKRVFLVGHSLGGLLCLNYAANSDVSGVILINTPLVFKVSLKQLSFSLRILFSPAYKDDEFLASYRQAFSVTGGKWYEYPLWLRQFIGLYRYIGQTKKLLKDVRVKTIIIQSVHDESVLLKSMGLLKSGLANSKVEVIRLEESYHGYFPPEDRQLLVDTIANFIKNS